MKSTWKKEKTMIIPVRTFERLMAEGKLMQEIIDKKEEHYKLREKLVINQVKKDVLEEVQKLIAEEIVICQKEGTPTSRLTSLANKLSLLEKSGKPKDLKR
jgi:hypothetical protein